ncbi:hypothetical protein [Mucisphaera calidilacus]|uniref:Uncharacterized protein n=1 Tax=Mucisphaera calidilacus TaxID=2527982 RepID=A0A518BYY3_9BACT|nr:hypothetical protein [Mucisphaera calidilacus]QDU72179.1 hypothetical protein Pan265_20420 [Mucisphaera calidilacus]
MTTSESQNLLRMLEPAVRPGQAQGPSSAAKPAFEQQPFDQLLAQATTDTDPTEPATENASPAARMLNALDNVENASVRRLLEQPANKA